MHDGLEGLFRRRSVRRQYKIGGWWPLGRNSSRPFQYANERSPDWWPLGDVRHEPQMKKRSEVNEDEVNVCSPQQNEFGQRVRKRTTARLHSISTIYSVLHTWTRTRSNRQRKRQATI